MTFEHNVFSTKFWTPGAIPFRFADETESCESLIAAFERHGGGQIVGPHGSGKSTLIESLKKVFLRNEYDVRHAMLNDRNRRLAQEFSLEPLRDPGVRIVDGYEQLALWQRWRLRLKFPGRFLIVTHRPVARLPILYRTVPRFDVFVELVRLLGGEGNELRNLFETARGNFRDAFMTLYDRQESRNLQFQTVCERT